MNVRFYLLYDIKITFQSHFWCKKVIIASLCTQGCYGRHNVSRKSVKQLVVYRFYCMALFHSQTQRHMIKDLNGCSCIIEFMNQVEKTVKFVMLFIAFFPTNLLIHCTGA